MDGNGCVSECLSDATLVFVDSGPWRKMSSACSPMSDNDIIRHHMPELLGVIGLLATEVKKQKKTTNQPQKKRKKEPPNTLKNKK